MTKLMLHTCSAVALLVVSSTFAADPIRAGYKVILTKGEDTWRATTVVPVSVKEDKADRYSLLVRVTGQPGTPTENSEFIRKSFPGSHKEQLEFTAAEAGLTVKGVIFVGPLKSAAK